MRAIKGFDLLSSPFFYLVIWLFEGW